MFSNTQCSVLQQKDVLILYRKSPATSAGLQRFKICNRNRVAFSSTTPTGQPGTGTQRVHRHATGKKSWNQWQWNHKIWGFHLLLTPATNRLQCAAEATPRRAIPKQLKSHCTRPRRSSVRFISFHRAINHPLHRPLSRWHTGTRVDAQQSTEKGEVPTPKIIDSYSTMHECRSCCRAHMVRSESRI